MAQSNETAALEVVSRLGVVRPSDLEAHGIPRSVLANLLERGLVVREARGIYTAAGHPITENHTLAVVSKSVPTGIVCLLSALRFHELTTQSPSEVWIAIPIKARRPRLEYPQLRVARFSGDALTEGVELHRVEGVEVKVYSAAKTVADCFKYRNKIGVDVAVEALRDFGKLYRGRASELARFAKVCRVSRVMQPYLDAIA
ncbi:MAG: type IV toxin-antitoxin system AbiEi family antitoxin domain-containing protein [Candidatus Eisenbacteria bacterium]